MKAFREEPNCKDEWLALRKNLVTASNFGKIIKRKKRQENLVKNILYKQNISHVKYVAHGIKNEQIAIQQLAAQEKLNIQPSGLFIHPVFDFIGATPDGEAENDCIVEVKCPVAASRQGMSQAIQENKVHIFRFNKKKVKKP